MSPATNPAVASLVSHYRDSTVSRTWFSRELANSGLFGLEVEARKLGLTGLNQATLEAGYQEIRASCAVSGRTLAK